MAEHSRDIIWTLNMDGSIGYVSPAVERILGFTPEEQRKRLPEEMMTPASLELASREGDEEATRTIVADIVPLGRDTLAAVENLRRTIT